MAVADGLTPRPGVDFDHRRADLGRGLDLLLVRADEQRNADASRLQFARSPARADCAGAPRRARLRWSLPAAAPARYRPHAGAPSARSSTISRVAAISKFSGLVSCAFSRAMSSSRIWRRSSRRCAVMPSAPASTAARRGFHRIGMAPAARIADGRDVIDVDAEAELGRRTSELLTRARPAASNSLCSWLDGALRVHPLDLGDDVLRLELRDDRR